MWVGVGSKRGMWVHRGRDNEVSQAIVTVSDVTLRTHILINASYYVRKD